jgi:RNA polymerase sigma factor (sigma-70 family)
VKAKSEVRATRGRRRDQDTGFGRIGTDRVAFAALYEAHFDEVLRFVTRRVADPHTAADLTAEVFVAALAAAASYRGEGTAGAWLTGIARHVVAAEYRRAARDREIARRAGASRMLDADDINRLEERIDAERHARELYARVRLLPPGEREVLESVAVDGMSLAAAAAAAGISPVAARVRLHRARRALRRAIVPEQQTGTAGSATAPVEVQQ